MFVLGHLGIGKALGDRVLGPVRGARLGWLLLGTLLPDLIDKPLYYATVALVGREVTDAGLISGTRTFGHTVLFGLVCAGLVRLVRGREAAGPLLLGLATHWLLDLGGGWFGQGMLALGYGQGEPLRPGPGTEAAIFFPLFGLHFPINPARSLLEHLFSQARLYQVLGEVTGAGLLLRDWVRRRRQRALGSSGPAAPLVTAAPAPPRRGAPDR